MLVLYCGAAIKVRTESIDAGRLTLMLSDLRLPAIKQDWSGFAARAEGKLARLALPRHLGRA